MPTAPPKSWSRSPRPARRPRWGSGRVRAVSDRDQGGKARAAAKAAAASPGSPPPGCAWATLGEPLGVDWGGAVLGTGNGGRRTSGSRCESGARWGPGRACRGGRRGVPDCSRSGVCPSLASASENKSVCESYQGLRAGAVIKVKLTMCLAAAEQHVRSCVSGPRRKVEGPARHGEAKTRGGVK